MEGINLNEYPLKKTIKIISCGVQNNMQNLLKYMMTVTEVRRKGSGGKVF